MCLNIIQYVAYNLSTISFVLVIGASPVPAGAWVKENSGGFRSKILQKGGHYVPESL